MPEVRVPSTMPPEPRTSSTHARCFFGNSNDCSTKISREHYISKAILDMCGDLTISGMPWQQEGDQRRLALDSLTANILCDRHNHALSPLDTLAAKFFRSLEQVHEHTLKRSLSRKRLIVLGSGQGMEMWAFKTIAGLFHGRIARANGGILNESAVLNETAIMQAVFGGRVPSPAGMYVRPATGAVENRMTFSFAPLVSEDERNVVGLVVYFKAFDFAFLINADIKHGRHLVDLGYIYRPVVISMSGPSSGPNRSRLGELVVTWPESFLGRRTVNVRMVSAQKAS